MINVTKTFLPPFEEYTAILKRAWDSGWITNNGELVQELEQKLKEYLDVEQMLFCSNGTVVLQMALKALGISKEVITTPFSYVATTNAILWEGCTPVFVDIDPQTFCIDPAKIEAAITPNTQAILATHVYGYPCDVEAIQEIAQKHGLKVIYDGAHAFGVQYKGKSLLSYGDISTCSFHATKVFHTVEGGALFTNDPQVFHQLMLYRQFGHVYDDYQSVGINAKNSEFHAAMGLAVLPYLQQNILLRKVRVERYVKHLGQLMVQQVLYSNLHLISNFSYCVIQLENEEQLLKVKQALENEAIYPRRYFFPALHLLPYLNATQNLPVVEEVAATVLSLPLSAELSFEDIDRICSIILKLKGVI